MAKSNSLFDVLLEIVARVPWWICRGLAIVSYFVIHQFSLIEIPTPTSLQDMGNTVSGHLIKVFARFGQYLVPAAFGFGTIASWLARRMRAHLYQHVAGQPNKSALEGISWRQFEILVGEWFRKQDYTVNEMANGADGGVDLILSRGG
jgi:restriction system protein